MRIVGLMLSLALAGSPGCKTNAEDASAAADPAALKAQNELVERRDALMAQRQELEGERERIDQEIKKVTASGGDASELAKKRAALDSQIEDHRSNLSSISSKIDKVVARTDVAAGIAGREAGMASREKQVAAREAAFADRERGLAAREAAIAQREKETCGFAGPTIVQVAAPKGGNYTRHDIEPLLGRARAMVSKKGLVPSDLGPAANLETEATSAMKNDDWGKAYLAAAQLVATVDSIKIDRNFIGAKAARLQTVVKRSKRDDAIQRQLADGMQDVMQKFGDGDFAAANRKLNQLSTLVK